VVVTDVVLVAIGISLHYHIFTSSVSNELVHRELEVMQHGYNTHTKTSHKNIPSKCHIQAGKIVKLITTICSVNNTAEAFMTLL
jgi:hypothetical protein